MKLLSITLLGAMALSVSATAAMIHINEQLYTGDSLALMDEGIYIDEKLIEAPKSAESGDIKIFVEGELSNLTTYKSIDRILVNGNVNSITTHDGNISAKTVGSASTVTGKITAKAIVEQGSESGLSKGVALNTN